MFWTIAGGVCVGIILAAIILNMTEDDWQTISSLIKGGAYVLIVVAIVFYVKANGLPEWIGKILNILGYIFIIGYGLFWIMLMLPEKLAHKIDNYLGGFLEKFIKKSGEDIDDNKLNTETTDKSQKNTLKNKTTKRVSKKEIDKTAKDN